MNIGLYEEITNKLNALAGDEVKPEKLRILMGQWSNRAYPVDVVSVLCAFYNYMDGKVEYSFIHNVPAWDDFFRQRFTNYFTIDTIKANFNNIILKDKIVDIILQFVPEEVQKEFYEYAALVNGLNKEKRINVYEKLFDKLEAKLVAKGLIDKPIKEEEKIDEQKDQETSLNIENVDVDGTEISIAHIDPLQSDNGFVGAAADSLGLNVDDVKNENIGLNDIIEEPSVQSEQFEKKFATAAELSAEIRRLEAEKKAHRDNTFDAASSYLGISSNDLIKKVGNEQSFDIDGINIDSKTKNKLTSNDNKIASIPNNTLRKIATKVNKRNKLNRMGLEIVSDNNVTMLNIVKKDTVFDKIATTNKRVVEKIKRGARIAGTMALGGVVIGAIAVEEVIRIVKKAEQNMKESISDAKINLNSKTANSLRNIADKLSPTPDIILQTENTKPTIDISNPKVILSAGTQVGSISTLEQKAMGK